MVIPEIEYESGCAYRVNTGGTAGIIDRSSRKLFLRVFSGIFVFRRIKDVQNTSLQ